METLKNKLFENCQVQSQLQGQLQGQGKGQGQGEGLRGFKKSNKVTLLIWIRLSKERQGLIL